MSLSAFFVCIYSTKDCLYLQSLHQTSDSSSQFQWSSWYFINQEVQSSKLIKLFLACSILHFDIFSALFELAQFKYYSTNSSTKKFNFMWFLNYFLIEHFHQLIQFKNRLHYWIYWSPIASPLQHWADGLPIYPSIFWMQCLYFRKIQVNTFQLTLFHCFFCSL